MRSNKLVCMLVITIIICLLIIAIPTTPTLASESLRVSPTKGAIGDEINVRGSGYDRGERAYVYFSSRKAGEGVDIEELGVWERVKKTSVSNGGISGSFRVPHELADGGEKEQVRPGEHFVYSTYAGLGKNRSAAPVAEIMGWQNDAISANYHYNILGPMLDTGYSILDNGQVQNFLTLSSIKHRASSIEHPVSNIELEEKQ